MSGIERFTTPLVIGHHEIKIRFSLGGMSVQIGTGKLAGAVAEYGGAAAIGCAGPGYKQYKGLTPVEADLRAVRDQIRIAREISRGNGMVGVNVLAAVTHTPQLVIEAAKNGADFIAVGAGLLDPELLTRCPNTAFIPIVSKLRTFDVIRRQWKRHGRLPDAVICEEPATAGGHLGASKEDIYKAEYRHEFVLPQIRAYLDQNNLAIPLIAAGGIWDRTDIARVMELGADAVQMSTRFVCTDECEAPLQFKEKYVNCTPDDIAIIKSPIASMPGRVIKTDFSDRFERGEIHDQRCIANCLKRCSLRVNNVGYCIIDALHHAFIGDVENGIVFAGSKAHLSKFTTTRQILDELTGS